MFTDQVGSTATTAQRTPAERAQVAREHERLTAEVLRTCRGAILKDTGDGHFIEFPSCGDAVRCGALLQRRVRESNDAQPGHHLRFELHVGIDMGEVEVLENGDLRGNAANRAARVCSECPAGEVYFTDKVMRELHEREACTARVGSFQLKGVAQKVTIHRLVEWLGAPETTTNPFIWRAGITRGEDFFDRDREQRTLRTYLGGRQGCQVVGPRRIGKTSLLRQVERMAPQWESAAVAAYVDLQDARCSTLSGWLKQVCRGFGFAPAATTMAEFADDVDDMLREGRRPVLCLDEFEAFNGRAEFTRRFFSALRSCGQQGMSVVTASQKRLSELTDPGDPASSFYNTLPLLPLGPFPAAEEADFVALPRPGVSPFTPEEKQEILAFAKAHPLALQVACFQVLEAKDLGEGLGAALRRAEDDMRAHLPTW
jgi:class 3 adenylate cyclase